MKITIVHSVYHRNPFILQTVILNLLALNQSKVDYQYLLYNDNGDEEIFDDVVMKVPDFNLNNIGYIYSPINYGKKMCSGGYVGAIPYIEGDIVHHVAQDDVYTSLFYSKVMETYEQEPDLNFVTVNGFKVDEQLNCLGMMINPIVYFDYRNPIEGFKQWFKITPPSYEVTSADNYFLAPGTTHKTKLHDLIGPPDLENFRGAADFEYWARILYYGYKGHYINQPLWMYRISKYSAGNEIIDGKPNRGYWQQRHIAAIKEKYTQLVKHNKDKFQ